MSPPAVPPASASELKPVDPEWVERFRRDFDALCVRAVGGALADDAPVALAVSGGPDSMAMLLLAAAAFPGRILAATVDHGLRPEAAGEAAMVAAVCAGLGVPHETLSPEGPIAGSSIQKQAREARYDTLLSWAGRCGAYPLLTAHHADDQAETLLMRLNRASGVAGLSGIRPWRFERDGLLLRPLLGWRRGRLRMIAEAAGVPWADDPSNEDPRHDRTRFRAFLTHQTLLDPAALAQSAAHIGESEDALEALTRMFEAERWSPGKRLLRAADLPREVQRRLVRRAVAETRAAHGIAAPAFSDAANIEPLLDALAAGRPATQAGVMVTPERDGRWRFAPAPPRRSH
ncbi:tRNA lysidine(34) synthetase TilS [Sphingomonas sp. MS122]|uniref:tRNA lysidine(34) synthetase TilS n=1 Tax=Sphingomonas sp. MS122 TaxID=3412683 RepID=UPI003C2C73BB